MSVDTVFGLSLGSFQGTIAVYKNERAEVLANEAGERGTQMMVTYKKDSILVGAPAKQSLYRNIHNTAVSMTTLLSIDDSKIQEVERNLTCKIETKDGKVYYNIKDVGLVSVEETLVHVLKQLAATAHLCDAVTPIPIVLATPTGGNEQIIQSLRGCAERAKFKVLSTVTNPVLSVLPYGIGSQTDSFSGHILVYEIGMRTLSLTLIRCDKGMIRIIHCEERHGVGGANLDEALLELLKKECQRTFRHDISSNQRAVFKLLAAAENAKHSLSTQQTTNVYVESLHEGMDFQCTLTRGKFEGVCLPIFKSCLEPLQGVYKSTGLTQDDIQKVILVGGTCKVPILQTLLQEHFPSSEILSSIPPDHVVAMGAAIQGGYYADYNNELTTVPESIPCVSKNVFIRCSNCENPISVPLVPRHIPVPYNKSITLYLKPEKLSTYVLLQLLEDDSTNEEKTIAQIEVPLSLVSQGPNDTLQLSVELIWSMEPNVRVIVKDVCSEWRTEITILINEQ